MPFASIRALIKSLSMKELVLIFITIFLAELGDKTQLATLSFATKYGWVKAFLGSVFALAVVNLIGAVLGDRIGHLLPTEFIQKGAGLLFIAFGLLILAGKL